jgi:hypothetical protein
LIIPPMIDLRASIAAIPLLILSSCSRPTAWDACERLVGTWEDRTSDTLFQFAETWVRTNDTLITGRGWGLAHGDTVFKEELRLIARGDRVIYAARVPDQNQGRWVEFVSRPAGDPLVFENPAHDFPRRIAYIPEGRGWHVVLTGAEQGEAIEQHLRFAPRVSP